MSRKNTKFRLAGVIIGCLCLVALQNVYAASADAGRVVSACLDVSDFEARLDKDSDAYRKLSTDPTLMILLEAFKRIGINVDLVTDRPWKRCLQDVASGYVDFAFGAYWDPERERLFDYSQHYNTRTPAVFYLATKNLKIASGDDLAALAGCGIYGYSYTHYQLRPDQLTLGPSYQSLVRKMDAGRCDYFLDELESMYDSEISALIFTNRKILFTEAKWATAPTSHIVTKKNGANATLLKEFDTQLARLIDDGTAEKFWRLRYKNIKYKP